MPSITITRKLLAKYVGGQMEIKNYKSGSLSRGQVKTIVLQKEKIDVEFDWLAKNEGTPENPKGWVKSDPSWSYVLPLKHFSVSNIGDNLRLETSDTGEVFTLFPSDGERIDPAMVAGLQLAEA